MPALLLAPVPSLGVLHGLDVAHGVDAARGPPPSCPAGDIGACCGDAALRGRACAHPFGVGQMLLLDSGWVLPASLRAGAEAPCWTKPWGLLRVPEPRFVPHPALPRHAQPPL